MLNIMNMAGFFVAIIGAFLMAYGCIKLIISYKNEDAEAKRKAAKKITIAVLLFGIVLIIAVINLVFYFINLL